MFAVVRTARAIKMSRNATKRVEIAKRKNLCLGCSCKGRRLIRGLCNGCYQAVRRAIRAGETTEEELAKQGRILESRSGRRPSNAITKLIRGK